MAWQTPPTWTPGQLVGATDMAILSNDLVYLLNRPATSIKRDNNANYTVTSTIFVDIDGTNLSIVLTISGSAILMGFTGVFLNAGSSADFAQLDFTVDGTRYASAGTDGLGAMVNIASVKGSVTLLGMATGLSTGAHTIKIQWKSSSGVQVVLLAGAGAAGNDHIPTLLAAEVG